MASTNDKTHSIATQLEYISFCAQWAPNNSYNDMISHPSILLHTLTTEVLS